MKEETAPAGAVGYRLARQRTLAGLSEQRLAACARVSASLISQVEQGVMPASPSFTAAVARALGIDVETLYGQPYGSAVTDPKADHAGVPALRAAVDSADDSVLPCPPMTAAELRARLNKCNRDRAHSRYAQMTAALPELLYNGHALAADARFGVELDTAWSLLADAYALVQMVAYRFGYLDLAALCNVRCRQAAGRSGDSLRVAIALHEHGLLRLHRGDYDGVLRVIACAHAAIAAESSPAADAVRAQMHLRQAIAAARDGAADRAEEHITAARELVALGIPASPYYNVIASAANVDIHWVAVSVELSEGSTAVSRAEQVTIFPGEEPSRVGHHWIDVARAWTLQGDHGKALDALNRARSITPQQTRYHPQVHETLHLLVEADRRTADSLAGFARWVGIQL